MFIYFSTSVTILSTHSEVHSYAKGILCSAYSPYLLKGMNCFCASRKTFFKNSQHSLASLSSMDSSQLSSEWAEVCSSKLQGFCLSTAFSRLSQIPNTSILWSLSPRAITKQVLSIFEPQVQQCLTPGCHIQQLYKEAVPYEFQKLDGWHVNCCVVLPTNIWVVEVTHMNQVVFTWHLLKWCEYCYTSPEILVWRSMADVCCRTSWRQFLWAWSTGIQKGLHDHHNWLLHIQSSP